MSIRVLLADDHQLFREGLRSLLEKDPGIEVVGEADSGRTALYLAMQHAPDVVIMDVSMPDLSGVEGTRQIMAALPGVRVIGLSAHGDRRFVTRMLEAGAAGYVTKDRAFDELARAIRTVVDRLVYLSPSVAGGVVQSCLGLGGEAASDELKALSPRQREVLQLIAEGESTKRVAARMHVSTKTVETHRQIIMKKIGASSVQDLVKYALREGLISME
jgi:two-component system, NarL family, response regulator NreC